MLWELNLHSIKMIMSVQLKAFSISYKNTPLEIREKIALNESECKALMLQMREVLDIAEVVILSTCNRTEVYFIGDDAHQQAVLKLLAVTKGLNSEALMPYVNFYNDETEALTYLFEVGTGLHSQVIGDLQIPNQIKNAYQWSADVNMSGPFMHRLMHTVFYVNKRVVQETAFRDGAASTSYAAVDTIETFLPLLHEPKILVVGLGEIGLDVIKTLVHKGYSNFTVTNRTIAKAEKLSSEIGCEILPFESLAENLFNYDIIISSVMAPEPVITTQMVQQANQNSLKYFVDLSIPRSIEPAIEQTPGMVVFDLDEIQQKANAALEKRKNAVADVKNIIEQTVLEFSDWSNQMVVSPTIQKLKNALEQIRKEEMARYMKSLNDEEAAKVDKITSSMMQKIMKLPVLQLKAACKRGEAETLIDVLNDLFDLEKVNI